MGWRDDGVSLRLYVSISGDFVSLGTRTEIPMVAGGGGIPAGFSLWNPSNPYSIMNLTTQNGRFSISNNVKPAANQVGTYGIQTTVSVPRDKRFIMNVQAQTMDGKSLQNRYVQNARTANGNAWGFYQPSVSPWETMAMYSDFATFDDTLYLRLGVYNDIGKDDANYFWGVQYQNLSYLLLDKTYPPPEWKEVTCDIRSFQTTAGRERTTSRYEVGSCSVGILNDDGEWSYQPDHPWGLRPGRFVKVEATYNATTYPVFYGIIDGFSDGYTLDGRVLTVMNCVDTSTLLSNQTVPSMSMASTYQLSGYRFQQLLNGVAWHPSYVSAQTGQFKQQGVVANGRTVRDELGLIADSEGSYFYADRSGVLTYKDRNWSEDRITRVGAELLAQPEPDPVQMPFVHFQFPGVASNMLSTPQTPAMEAMALTMEITVRLSLPSWVGAQATFVARWGVGSAWILNKVAGQARPSLTVNAAGTARAATADVPYGPNVLFWMRATYATGTGLVSFYTAPDSENEPTVWTQLGAGVQNTPGQPVGTGTAPLTVGANSNGVSPLTGRIARAIVRSQGTLIFDVAEVNAYGQAGATSFVSGSQHPITVNQTAGNVIVQDASTYDMLPLVDTVPTLAGAPVICTNEFSTSWSRDRVVNEVSLANQGGSAFTKIDSDSQKKYGPRTYQRMDLLNANDYPEYLATRIADIMDGYTEALMRVGSISFRAAEISWVWLLNVWLNDLVRVRYENPENRWGFSVVAHIQGISHSADINDWKCTVALDDYEAFNFWVSAEEGQGWDSSEWDTDYWDGGTAADWNRGYVWSDPDSFWGA